METTLIQSSKSDSARLVLAQSDDKENQPNVANVFYQSKTIEKVKEDVILSNGQKPQGPSTIRDPTLKDKKKLKNPNYKENQSNEFKPMNTDHNHSEETSHNKEIYAKRGFGKIGPLEKAYMESEYLDFQKKIRFNDHEQGRINFARSRNEMHKKQVYREEPNKINKISEEILSPSLDTNDQFSSSEIQILRSSPILQQKRFQKSHMRPDDSEKTTTCCMSCYIFIHSLFGN